MSAKGKRWNVILSDEEDSDGGDSVLSEELPIADHVLEASFNSGGKGKQIGCNSASSFYGKHSSRPGSKNMGDSLIECNSITSTQWVSYSFFFFGIIVMQQFQLFIQEGPSLLVLATPV